MVTWSSLGIDISRIKDTGKVTCPKCIGQRVKHKNDKSLSVDVVKGVYNCHHCGWGGTINPGNKKVYEKPPEWRNITSLPSAIVKLFNERGISSSTLIENKIGYDDIFFPQKNRKELAIQYPYFKDGQIANIKSRSSESKDFTLYKNAELVFYGLQDVVDCKDIVIVEGENDKLAYWEVGIKNVISVPNGAPPVPKPGEKPKDIKMEYLDNCWEIFESVDTVYIATDDDPPGERLADELARRIGKHRCKRVKFFGENDPNDLLRKDRLSLSKTILEAKDYPLEGIVTVDDVRENVLKLKKSGLKPGAQIGINGFDDHLSFEPGYWTLVTGIPGHGKSEWVDEICERLAYRHGWKTGYYSPENYPIELHLSKLCTRLMAKHFNDQSNTEIDRALGYANENFFFITPKEASLKSILEHAKRLVLRYGIKILVIDAWNRLEHLWTVSETKYVSETLDELDEFLREYGVHALVVAHPTKTKYDKDGKAMVARLGDVLGSASWEAKAPNGISVYLENYDDGSKETIVYFLKVKFDHWGKTGAVPFRMNKSTRRFYKTGTMDDIKSHVSEDQLELDFL